MGEASALGKTSAQTRHLVETCHGSRYATPRLHGVSTVTLGHPHTRRTGIRMSIHKVDDIGYGVFAYYGVRIEQQHVFAGAAPYCQIVGARKTKISVAAYHLDPRETARKIIHRTVPRVIIHHIHLAFDVFRRLLKRVQTLFKIELDVIVDYYDRKFQYIVDFYASVLISDLQRSLVGTTKNRHKNMIMPIYPKATFINI